MTIVVIGQHYWGKGQDVDEAKRNFKREGGSLVNGYTILEFSNGLIFRGVDQMGRVHWDDQHSNSEIINGRRREPKATEVKPRKREESK